VLITSAEREPIDEAIWFHRTLEHGGLPFAGVIVNRVHHDLLNGSEPDDVRPALRRSLGADLAARVAQNFDDYHVLARRDDRNVERLAQALGDEPLLPVPQLDQDVHDLEGLLQMQRYLFASDAEREQLLADVVA
jgi:anion-transporting  ArsA/GET3 family ATPase